MARPGRDARERDPNAAPAPREARADDVRRRLQRGEYEIDLERLADALRPELGEPRNRESPNRD